MENSLTWFLSTVLGGAIAIVTQYFIEFSKSKNEKYKFSLDRIISVGEKFYTLSGYALYSFEANLHTLEKINSFNSSDAQQIFLDVEKTFQEQLKVVQQNNIVITAADIYFNVSSIADASNWTKAFTHALATLVELKDNEDADYNQIIEVVEKLKKLLNEMIDRIKKDQKTISIKIKKMIESDTFD